MIRYVIFDFDGTLVDSKDVFLNVINQFSAKYNMKKIELEDVESLIKLPVSERCKKLNIPFYRIPVLAQEVYHGYKSNLKSVRLIEGIADILYNLQRRGYKLAVISSNSEANIREFLKINNIDCLNDIFCSSNIFGKDKVIRKFLRNYNLNSNEIIYIGDEHRDIEACKKCGVKIIWVSWGYDTLELASQENPDYIADKPSDILKYL